LTRIPFVDPAYVFGESFIEARVKVRIHRRSIDPSYLSDVVVEENRRTNPTEQDEWIIRKVAHESSRLSITAEHGKYTTGGHCGQQPFLDGVMCV
jgi:hypothetical protein